MVENKIYYRKQIENLINTNPITINITRMEKISDGYGGYITTETNHDETVTLYQKRSSRESIDESGVIVGHMVISVNKILAKSEADILENDKFEVNGKEYKVLFVNDYLDICKQIELRVVKNDF